jgi:hypothetical protein
METGLSVHGYQVSVKAGFGSPEGEAAGADVAKIRHRRCRHDHVRQQRGLNRRARASDRRELKRGVETAPGDPACGH